MLVMVVNYLLFSVAHASVTDLNGVAVNKFMKDLVIVEVYVQRCKKSVSDVCTDILT